MIPRRLSFLRFAFLFLLFILTAVGLVIFSGRDTVKADGTYHVLTVGTPFTQNWSSPAQITIDDNWGGVLSIIGYRGDDLTVVTGTDPQTILADGSATPVDVIANQANPNTQATGGVAEFDGIANPSIGLQGSGTADAPHIDIRLDTTGCVAPNTIEVSYNVRDLDGSADNSVQPVALHYRIGAAGSYTNHPFGFVADGSAGPNVSGQVTNVFVALPPAAQGQAQVHVRMMTANAVGNDEWVGIDDISIECATPSAASVSLGGRVMTANGRGIAKVMVTVSGGTLTAPRTTLTSPFGYYSVGELEAGQTYIVTVGSKSYTFAVPSRSVQLVDSISDADFTAEP